MSKKTVFFSFQNFAIYISQQLDLCLREALHLDGVIEIRNEKFWTVSFGNYVSWDVIFSVEEEDKKTLVTIPCVVLRNKKLS